MNLLQLWAELRARGLAAQWVPPDGLRMLGPKHGIDDALRRAIRHHKSALLAILQAGPSPSLSLLRREGELAPLILIPGLAALPQGFHPLANSSSWRRPLYGLAYPEPDEAPRELPGLVAHFAALLERCEGPYHLGGHSLGGLVALHLADRLAQTDRAPQTLILLDSYRPTPENRQNAEQDLRDWFVQQLTLSLGAQPQKLNSCAARDDSDFLAQLAHPDSWPEGLPSGLDPSIVAQAWARTIQGHAYHLGFTDLSYDRRVLLVEAAVESAFKRAGHRWQGFFPRLETKRMEADHEGLLRPEQADQLAQWLEAQMEPPSSA